MNELRRQIAAYERHHRDCSRRTFLKRGFAGLGGMALGHVMASAGDSGPPHLITRGGVHFPARAKRVIHLCMAGGPSHLESFDPKPKLDSLHGQTFPGSYTAGQQLAQLQGRELIARGSFTKFRRYGESGLDVSDLFPHIGSVADEICVIRSMVTGQINHDPAHALMNTGSILKGRPSMGSWLLYGLGSETRDVPGYVVMVSRGSNPGQPVSACQWSSGFLPSRFQGVRLNVTLRGGHAEPEFDPHLSQYELAFRMQSSVPDLTDMSDEPDHIRELYGVKEVGDGSFASNCLLARRMLERGVRFVQLYHHGWDHHSNIEGLMTESARLTDQPSAALIKDLKQRGMLDDTLVIWGGEFGRTPMGQGTGRDHHINAFSIWMAGAGIRPGMVYGETDELGYATIRDPVHVRDLHATVLHQFGIDHSCFSAKFQGFDCRLTGEEPAKVVRGILL